MQQLRDSLLDVSEVLAGLGIEGQLAIQKTINLSIEGMNLLIVNRLISDLLYLDLVTLSPVMDVLGPLTEARG